MADRSSSFRRAGMPLLTLALLSIATSARGQVDPFLPPPISQPVFDPHVRPVSKPPLSPSALPISQERLASNPYLNESIDLDRLPTVYDGLPLVDEQIVVIPRGQRDGVYQGSTFTGTWLAKPSGGDLGMTELYVDSKFGFPMPTRESPMIVTPAFGVTFTDGPLVPDLPAQLYDATLELRWMRQVSERWAIDVAVKPGMHSDFQSSQSRALRVEGRGMAFFDWTLTAKLVLGIVYLDRTDVSLLPAAGVIWTPHDDLSVELVAPRPRIAWRFMQCVEPECVEHWAYVAGEFGGGEWAIRRSSGADDVVTYRDYRIILGVERKVIGGIKSRLEVGYVFGRELEYASATPDFSPDDTLMLRVGASF